MDFIISYVRSTDLCNCRDLMYGSYSYITSSFGVWNKKAQRGSLRRKLEQIWYKIFMSHSTKSIDFVCFFKGRIHLWMSRRVVHFGFNDDSSVNFWTRFFFIFHQIFTIFDGFSKIWSVFIPSTLWKMAKIWQKMKKNLVQKLTDESFV